MLRSKIDVKIITQHEHKTDSMIVSSGFYNFIVDDNKDIKLFNSNFGLEKFSREYLLSILLNFLTVGKH